MTTTTFTIDFNGTPVHGAISPCSWMYEAYGFQFSLSLKERACNAECEMILDKTLPWSSVKDPLATAVDLAGKWLGKNGVAPLVAAVESWVKARAEFDAAMASEAVREQERLLKKMAKYKAQGFTHRIVAWVHPPEGEDYQTETFTRGDPSPDAISKALNRSVVKDTYTITAL